MNFFQKLVSGIKGAVEGFLKPFVEPEPIKPEVIEEPQVNSRVERLKEENRELIREANRKYNELIREDLDEYSGAFQRAKDSGGGFDVEDLDDEVSIIRETLRANEFINDPTSELNVASARKRDIIGKQTKEELEGSGIDLYRTRIHEDNIVKEFWDAVDRVREEENIGGRLKALVGYSADSAYAYAFNIWVESGFDQMVLRDSLNEFIEQTSESHTTEYKAVAGKATFEYGKDDW